MRGLLAVARREIVERRIVLAAAVLAGLVPIAVPLARGLGGDGALEVRSWTALLLSLAFGVGSSLGYGATMLAPAIASRRIAFDFARPLSAFAIWGGRLSASVVLAAATAAIVWMPASIAGSKFPAEEFFPEARVARFWPLLALAILVILFCLSHALAIAVRSRSSRLALDGILVVLAGFGVAAALRQLPSFLAHGPLLGAEAALLGVTALALLAAGHASVASGRTDISSAHRALSLTLWALVGSAVLGVNVYASWVMGAGPRNLEADFWVSPAERGPWVAISGRARGADADFLFDTATGRFFRAVVRWLPPLVSGDGRRAAWLQASDRGGPFPLWTWRLDDPSAKPARTRLLLNGYPSIMALSTDGSRLATLGAGVLSIYDLASERDLASLRIPLNDQERMQGLFVDNDRFRLYRTQKAGRIEILELDVVSRAGRQLGEVEGLDGPRFFFAIGPSGDRIVTLDETDGRVRLFDGGHGTLIATLSHPPAESLWPKFLSDGRVVLVERVSGSMRLRVFRPNGEEEGVTAPLAGRSAVIGGEAAPGLLVVGIADEAFRYASWLVDIGGKTPRRFADDLRPVSGLFEFPAVGSEATRLFYGSGGALVHLDPLTGERRTLLGGP